MYKVAVVEDSERDTAILRSRLERYAEEHQLEIAIDCHSSTPLFLQNYANDYDIVFMDIDMPLMNGMEAAKLLRSMDAHVLLVFVTALARFAVNGYEVKAFDFLIKPLEYPIFSIKMDRCMRELAAKDERRILIHTPEKSITLRINDIVYVEINGHMLTFHMPGNDITTRGKIRDVMTAMDGAPFVMCNKWCIVSLRYVEQIDGNDVVMLGGIRLPVARARKTEFIQQIANYYGNKKINMGRF